MDERVHFIPVGFDFERLIHPISKEQLPADRVILVTHDEDVGYAEESQAAELAGNMARRLWDAFELIDKEIEPIKLTRKELYDYETLYPRAHSEILEELRDGNEVFVNISSMPRTVAFAFATAADSLVAEQPEGTEDIRDNLHTYYVPPEKYVVLEMLETMKEEIANLETVDDSRVAESRDKLRRLVEKVETGGVTEGTMNPGDGDNMYVEFPASPGSKVEGFERTVLHFLEDKAPFPSISDLAEALAEHEGEEYDGSFRSRVQYNVLKLEEKGYLTQTEAGNRVETSLSTMGRMWAETH